MEAKATISLSDAVSSVTQYLGTQPSQDYSRDQWGQRVSKEMVTFTEHLLWAGHCAQPSHPPPKSRNAQR